MPQRWALGGTGGDVTVFMTGGRYSHLHYPHGPHHACDTPTTNGWGGDADRLPLRLGRLHQRADDSERTLPPRRLRQEQLPGQPNRLGGR